MKSPALKVSFPSLSGWAVRTETIEVVLAIGNRQESKEISDRLSTSVSSSSYFGASVSTASNSGYGKTKLLDLPFSAQAC